MAHGRMLARKISANKDLPRLISLLDERDGAPHGAMAALLYTWSVAHLDIEGRMAGDPHVVKGNVVPRISFITPELVDRYLQAMAEVGLVRYYEADADRWLEFPGFDSAQPGLRKDREPASTVPASNTGKPIAGNPAADPPLTPAVTAAVSAHTKNLCAGEEKRIEEKRSEDINKTRARVMNAWRANTGNVIANPHDGNTMCDLIAEAVALEPQYMPEAYVVAFVEWARSCDPGKRPPIAPHKLVQHFATVQEWVRGERKAHQSTADPPRKRPRDVSEIIAEREQRRMAEGE